ncbi:MAG: folate family ECF transporter S component [Clostridia bacterium]|nr:folate family ECF transporter S component [Clostridia bacterium]
MKKTRTMVFMGLFVAMEVILKGFLYYQPTPTLRFTFESVVIAISAIAFGPILAGIGAVLTDIISYLLHPAGPFFPGLTLSAFLVGGIYGLILYNKKVSLIRVVIAAAVVMVFIELGLNTFWLSMLYQKGVILLFMQRLTKLFMLPVQVFVIYSVWRYAGKELMKYFSRKKEAV